MKENYSPEYDLNDPVYNKYNPDTIRYGIRCWRDMFSNFRVNPRPIGRGYKRITARSYGLFHLN